MNSHPDHSMLTTLPSRTVRRRRFILFGAFLTFFPLVTVAGAQDVADYFRQNCMSCHTIGGGRLTGPDLKNISERQSRDWLVKWLMDPLGVLQSGDPYAVKLKEEARGAVMTRSPGMTPVLANALLDLIEAESKLEQSQFMGVQISDRPFTPQDIEKGLNLFLGRTRLENGGPACVSCHRFNGLKGLGGGRLGPDLTKVFERMEDRKTLAAWLSAPATETMGPLFKNNLLTSEEVLSMVALFQDTAKKSENYQSATAFNFTLLGIVGAVLLLAVFGKIWKKRFKAVRTPLVLQEKLAGKTG